MWLVNTKTLELKEHVGRFMPEYAILSHTWGKEEVSFQDMKDPTSCKGKKGYRKIEMTCKMALQIGLNWAWVDTCCIDKSSSAELSEAINSMYQWYERAEICFAFISDLPTATPWDDILVKPSPCRWFKRGWTLQELIAPKNMYFFDQEWKNRGSKERLAESLSSITGIDRKVLLDNRCLSEFNVAQKMSWAAGRSTTRIEDTAYCLLGIFDVNMPLLYGEDKKAFRRLQEEIIRSIPDLSIFAWRIPQPIPILDPSGSRKPAAPKEVYGILAKTPNAFEFCAHFKGNQNPVRREFSISNLGVKTQTRLLMMQIPTTPLFRYILPLNCSLGPQRLLGLTLKKCGPNHFIRDDPWNIKEYNGILRPYGPTENYLLTSLPLTNLRADSSFLSIRSLITYTRPSVLAIESHDHTFVSDAWPMPRFDHENQLFFSFSDYGGDACAARVMIHPIVQVGTQNIPVSYEILFYAVGWAGKTEPQCSMLEYQHNSMQLNDFQSQIAGWDQETEQVIRHLNYNKIPRCRTLSSYKIQGTASSLLVSYKPVYTQDENICQNGFWTIQFSWEVMDTIKCVEPALKKWKLGNSSILE